MIHDLTSGTVAATGSTAADAAAVEAKFVTATAADATKGVILSSTFGKNSQVIIKNTVAAVLKVYPQTTAGTINGSTGAYSQVASKSALFINVGADTWHAIQLD